VLGGSAHASEVLTAAGIDPTARGEAIGVDDFVRLGRTVVAAAE
jgi:16S rRNA (adenine1518-N6/adenine1519-N6)-dimethyltransferase